MWSFGARKAARSASVNVPTGERWRADGVGWFPTSFESARVRRPTPCVARYVGDFSMSKQAQALTRPVDGGLRFDDDEGSSANGEPNGVVRRALAAGTARLVPTKRCRRAAGLSSSADAGE